MHGEPRRAADATAALENLLLEPNYREEAARALLTVLRVRGIAVPDAVRERVAACVAYVTAAVGVAPDLTSDTLPLVDHYLAQARALGAALVVERALEFANGEQADDATVVARLEVRQARWGYALIAGLAYIWLLSGVVLGGLPELALLAVLSLPLSAKAARLLLQHAAQPHPRRSR